MKVRAGFVSNSSSSSFVAIGFDIPYYGEEWRKFCSNYLKIELNSDDEVCQEVFEELQERTGLTLYTTKRFDIDQNKIGLQIAYGIEDSGYGKKEIEGAMSLLEHWRDKFNLDSPIYVFWGNYRT